MENKIDKIDKIDNIKIYNFDQKTDEWYNIRAGKFTGSDFHTLMGNSETKKTLLLKKTAERLLNKTLEDNNYTNTDIERGIELESTACLLYEMETNNTVEHIGFAELNDWVGCSPDGIIKDTEEVKNGIIEIKCPKDTVFLNQVINDKIKPEYYTQIQFNLYVLNKDFCDYIAYNQNYPLFIKRIIRDNEYIERIKECIEECKTKVINNMKTFKERIGD